MKTGRGWWALAITGVPMLLLAPYVGAYFWLVKEAHWYGARSVVSAIYPDCDWLDLHSFFQPIHEIDRNWLRPQRWQITL